MLRREVEDLKHLTKQLMLDTEDNDARIIKSYRAKILQLERQVQLLTKCNNIRSEANTDIENFVLEIVGEEEEDSTPMDRATLRKWGKMLKEKIKNYNILTKQAENQKYHVNSKFFGSEHLDTVQNVCNYSRNDDIPYLDVTNVIELENDLTQVYRNLYRMRNHLESVKETTKDTNFRLLSDITINNIAKVLNEMVDLSLVLPKKDRSETEEVSSSYKQFYNPMSLSSNEIMSKLPKIGNSKTSKEIEESIKNLVRAFHAQKSLFEIDLQMKQEELNIATKARTFYNTYFSEMLKEIESRYKDFSNHVQPLSKDSSNSTSTINKDILEEIIHTFEKFDKESTEEHLRDFLITFKDNVHLLDENQGPAKKKANTSQISFKSYFDRFKSQIQDIESAYEIRKTDFIEKMYNLNPEVERYENVVPFISYSPYDNSSTVAKKSQQQSTKRSNLSVNKSTTSVRASTKAPVVVKKDSRKPFVVQIDDIPAQETEQVVTPKITSPPINNNTKLGPNLQELVNQIEEKRKKINSLNESISSRSVSDMQVYAITKQIVSKAQIMKLIVKENRESRTPQVRTNPEEFRINKVVFTQYQRDFLLALNW